MESTKNHVIIFNVIPESSGLSRVTALTKEEWDAALGHMSGEGAETQLSNALEEMGLAVFRRVG